MIVSIQQAAANVFAGWLGQKMPDVVVEAQWPGPEKQLPPKAITVARAGARRDTRLDPRLLSKTNQGPTQTNAVWQVAACYQPLQLDIWADSDIARDDIVARLDQLLYAGESVFETRADPVGNGVLLAVLDGWEAYATTADFLFDDPELMNSDDEIDEGIYRATLRGGANFMLAVPATSARQAVLQIKLRLAETDASPSDPYDTYST